MTWTHFWDMHSGGSSKETVEHIFIEAPEDEAIAVFYSRFGHNPDRVSCTCCGRDYAIDEYSTLESATEFERECRYTDWAAGPGKGLTRSVISLEEYKSRELAHFIYADSITDEERHAKVPQQGYIWVEN